MFTKKLSGLALVALAFIALACSGGGDGTPTSPTSPADVVETQSADLVVQSADLVVGGQSVAGMTLEVGHGKNKQSVFKGKLMMGNMPAPGYEFWVEFDRPMGMMMGPNHGKFRLYDDGTHGDSIAGDGIYCFKDTQKVYGCNGAGMMAGEYHYQFFGMHADGRETNRMHVKVRLTQD